MTGGILCHCEIDPAGHEPGQGGCPHAIKAGTYRRSSLVGCDERGAWVGAKGTCPTCGREGVKVRRARVTGRVPGVSKVGRGHRLAYVPALDTHRLPVRGGGWCSGAGQVPAETTFVLSREVVDWARSYGVDSVELDGAAIDLVQLVQGVAA